MNAPVIGANNTESLRITANNVKVVGTGVSGGRKYQGRHNRGHEDWNGHEPTAGFWNTTPVAQQVLATGGGATVDQVITLLQTLGLCRQS